MAGDGPSRRPRKVARPGEPDGSGGGLRGAGTLFELAFTFAGTLLAGMGIGYYGGRWLDGWLGTAPWLQLLGLMLGVVAAFRVLWRTLQRIAGDEPATGDRTRTGGERRGPRGPAGRDPGGKGGPSS